ncbi:MAG: phospholipase D-like domain-containing protein [Pseudomonadota bacterium]
MPLNDATAHSQVEQWSAAADQAFAADEIEALVAGLIDLAAETTSRLVEDIAISDAHKQEVLLQRATAYLEDWIAIAARTIRGQFDTDPSWRKAPPTPDFPVGLRSANKTEMTDLPVIGDSLADKIAQYLTLNPQAEMSDLLEIKGIGATGLKALKATSYLDHPTFALLSPALLNFVAAPNVSSLIQVFDSGDTRLEYGDWTTHLRRGEADEIAPTAARLLELIDFAAESAKALPFASRGALASDASARLERHKLWAAKRDNQVEGTASLVVNDSYVAAAQSMIEAATDSLSLMVFLGTDAAARPGGVAPDVLIDALEIASQTVQVRVILDQDDVDDPYLSKVINLPLLNRLEAAGIPVKFDEKNVLLHSKLLIADEASVLVGSHNWTRSGFNTTHEVSLRADQPDIARAYQARFDTLWAALPA